MTFFPDFCETLPMACSVEELKGLPCHTVEGLFLLSYSPNLEVRPAALSAQSPLSATQLWCLAVCVFRAFSAVCWQMSTISFLTVPHFLFSPKVCLFTGQYLVGVLCEFLP